MAKRNLDNHETVYSFMHFALVKCPECGKCAQVNHDAGSEELAKGKALVRRERCSLTCTHCGHSKTLTEESSSGKRKISYAIGGPFDPYLKEPLWLQRRCCGEVLWAFNKEHLDFLKSFVEAKLRERRPVKQGPFATKDYTPNKALTSRLPKWIKAKENRDEVLRGIRELYKKLPKT